MKCRYFCRLPLDISPVYLTRGISEFNTVSFNDILDIMGISLSELNKLN